MIEALEGVFSPQAEDELVSHLTDAILRTNDASDNSLARRRLTMPGSHMPADKPYAAGKPEPFINVARRVPTSSPNTPEKRRAFVTTMTNTIEKAAASCLERDRIYINMPYGDRFWGRWRQSLYRRRSATRGREGKSNAILRNPPSVVRSNRFHFMCPFELTWTVLLFIRR